MPCILTEDDLIACWPETKVSSTCKVWLPFRRGGTHLLSRRMSRNLKIMDDV